MKTRRMGSVAVLAVAWTVSLCGQVSFNSSGSSWGTGGIFHGTGALLTSGFTPTGAYHGGIQVDASTYIFGLTSFAGAPTTPAHYNLGGTAIAAGTTLNLTFTGLSAAPDYLAYTGGVLQSYSYNGGTLSLTVTTTDPVASASDPTGTTLTSAFGLMLKTSSVHNFSGTVFRSDMFWEDITPMQNYAGTSFLAGLNADGQDGVTATFSAYLPISFLNANGILSPADCEAYLQKNSVAGVQLSGITRVIYAGANPGFPDEGTVWSYGGAPGFDFNGSGADPFVLATYSNGSWSDGDIGIAAVPEPSTYAALLGLAALGAAWRRRRGQ